MNYISIKLLFNKKTKTKQKQKKKEEEFPLWYNEIGGVLGVLGHRFDPRPCNGGFRIQRCRCCGLGHSYSSDLIPGPAPPYAEGQPKI